MLAGHGTGYRHADRADFDAELLIERRIADSIATDSRTGSGVGAPLEDLVAPAGRGRAARAALLRKVLAYPRSSSSARAASAPSRTP
jgi:hypothetical protein